MGTPGYPTDTPGYPRFVEGGDGLSEDGADGGVDEWIFDYERFMNPREVAKQRLLTADQPIAHDGKGGWAVDRSTGTAEWMGGEMQWDVMMREPYSKRDEPGLVDIPEHGGLPSPAPPDGEIARMSDNEARSADRLEAVARPGG